MKDSYKEEQNLFHIRMIILISIVFGIIYALSWYNDSVFSLRNFIIIFALILFILYGSRYQLSIDKNAIIGKFLFFNIILSSVLFKNNNITNLTIQKIKPILHFGGWGYRMTFTKRGYIFPASDYALKVTSPDHHLYFLSLSDPIAVKNVLDLHYVSVYTDIKPLG